MTNSPQVPAIALDGGGTRCRLALDDGTSRTIVETGSANVSTNFDEAIRQILVGLEELASRVAFSRKALFEVPAFIGVAGMTGPELAERLEDALPFATIRIEDDRPAALKGALGAGDGVIAHCGTGSFFAAQFDGVMRFAGGWGPVLGDEASAQWVGRQALKVTLDRVVDGFQPPSDLSEWLLAELGGASGIVRFAGKAVPTDFGALAPRVTKAAESGDVLARAVMGKGASEIAMIVKALGWTPGCAFCLTGGIGAQFSTYLPKDMRDDIVPPKGTPLDGGIALARSLAGEPSR